MGLGNDGKVYIGTDDGIAICASKNSTFSVERLDQKKGLPDKIVRKIVDDNAGNLWIGMQDKGICKYTISQGTFTIPKQFENWSLGQINALTKEKSGWWIATDESGLLFFEENPAVPLSIYKRFNNLDFIRGNKDCADNENNVWIISNSTIYQSMGRHLMVLDKLKNQKISFVHRLLCDRKNNLWFTPDQELVKINLNDSQKGSPALTGLSAWSGEEVVSLVKLGKGASLFGRTATRGAEPLVRFRELHVDASRLPKVVDHRASKDEGPVRNQRSTPACSAFALATAIDHAVGRWTGTPANVSVMEIWARYHEPYTAKAVAVNVGEGVGPEAGWPFDERLANSWVPCEDAPKAPKGQCGLRPDPARVAKTRGQEIASITSAIPLDDLDTDDMKEQIAAVPGM